MAEISEVIRIMPVERLMSECDNIHFKSPTCCYRSCSADPIRSHTIPENYLYKLNKDLIKVLTYQPRISRVLKELRPQYVMKVDKEEWSTFIGFCNVHDSNLFKSIDLFNGEMDKEKAALIHYRNICYGIHHIQTQLMRERHISQQHYDGEGTLEVNEIVKNLENRSFNDRLTYCLEEHLLRKKLLENMIESGDFDEMNFVEIAGGIENPIFSGRSTYLLHKNNELFDSPGYSYMPWITYTTLLTGRANHLVFCWLEDDKKHTEHFNNLINGQFKKVLEVLAYACSDSFAISEDFYNKHSHAIDEIIIKFRTY